VLTGYPDLVARGVHAGALTEAEALRRLSQQDPDGARAAFTRSLRTRDHPDEVEALAHARLDRGTRPPGPGATTTRPPAPCGRWCTPRSSS
jgi:hypothetical protein